MLLPVVSIQGNVCKFCEEEIWGCHDIGAYTLSHSVCSFITLDVVFALHECAVRYIHNTSVSVPNPEAIEQKLMKIFNIQATGVLATQVS